MKPISELQQEIHETAKEKGWWDEPREDGTCIALMHSELSEALEVLRKPDGIAIFSKKCLGIHAVEEEFADVIIRILDFAEHKGMFIEEAILAKMEYNNSREYRHGGKKF